MAFKRMAIEDWFDRYQYQVEVNIGESGVKFRTVGDLNLALNDLGLRYGHHRGAPELRESIAQDYRGLTAENICVTVGASEAIFSLVAALTGPEGQVLVEHPNYPTLYEAGLSLDRQVEFLPLRYEAGFGLDLAQLEGKITPKTKLVMLTHPNNPAGSIISAQELRAVVELIEASNAYLLMDETYRDLSYDAPPPPAATLSPKAISVSTMSKAYGVPGIRIGWLAASQEIVDAVRAVREQVTICNSVIGERIAWEILKQKQQFLPSAREALLANLSVLKGWFAAQSDLEWVVPRAGVVGFPRLVSGASADGLCRLLVEKYKTFVVPGSVFQMPEYFRIGFGIERHELVEGLSRLDEALAEWKSQRK
ncbi:MAG: aminotransferase class I/II-fold pyridoxal phosphate-dependent enzyme [Chloroflexi bacterium]|nr:aminotransferase class I/II-fold pyridoxal phosphate-dependent enzyme [Chloroflexota bacterium]